MISAVLFSVATDWDFRLEIVEFEVFEFLLSDWIDEQLSDWIDELLSDWNVELLSDWIVDCQFFWQFDNYLTARDLLPEQLMLQESFRCCCREMFSFRD